MALTDTKKAKDFMAGAPDITLKGDLRLQASVDDPFYRDNEGDRDEHSFRMFNKPYKELNEFELEEFQEEMMRLMNKFSSMDENEREFMRLVEEFMERGFNQQEAIEAAREEFDKKAMAYGGRAQYGLGSIVRSVKKAVKGVTKGIKDFAKSDAGKLALLAAGAYGLGGAKFLGGQGIFATGQGLSRFANLANIPSAIGGALNLSGDAKGMGAFKDALKIGGAGGVITGLLANMEQQEGETNQEFGARKARVRDQLNVQFKRLYPQQANESDVDYNIRINAMVEAADDQTVPVGEMADGGRVMRAMGDSASDNAVQAAGIEGLPLRQNSKGVKEIDLRKTGGFIPPVGVKEKADDIPAMLSNNEFVMTADAVRAAGGGSVNKGAQRMYDLMKNLESRVV